VGQSGSGCGWDEFCTVSELRDPECGWLSPDGTLKMQIRFVQFGGIVECKKGKEEELVGLKVKTEDKILQNVEWNAAGIPGPVRSQDNNFGWESLPGSQIHSWGFVNFIYIHLFTMIFRRFSSATSKVK
jgi:hypothetical protein